jgi:hypothetical protein
MPKLLRRTGCLRQSSLPLGPPPPRWSSTTISSAPFSAATKPALTTGIDVHARTEENSTPLHDAPRWRDLTALGLLIAFRADFNAAEKGGLPPLGQTAERLPAARRCDIAEFLRGSKRLQKCRFQWNRNAGAANYSAGESSPSKVLRTILIAGKPWRRKSLWNFSREKAGPCFFCRSARSLRISSLPRV